MVGSATFTTVTSRTIMSCPMQRTTSAAHRRRFASVAVTVHAPTTVPAVYVTATCPFALVAYGPAGLSGLPEHAAPARTKVTPTPATAAPETGFVTVTVAVDVLVPLARMLEG